MQVNLVEQDKAFKIKADGRTVGYITLDNYHQETQSGELNIYLFQRRNEGIGTKAVEEFLRRLPGLKIIRLQVEKDNYHAMHVYAKNGFEKTGELGNRFIMERRLP